VGVIDAAALGPCKKCRPTDEKKKSVLYFDCDFSGLYNFVKIIKTVANKCNILKLKCTSAPPDPLAGFKGPTSKGKQPSRRGGEGKG